MDHDPHPERLRVGAVAAATGVTVRALHHYDRLKLIAPSGRTATGHRLYLPKDVSRLLRIVSLRRLGLTLEQTAQCLDGPDGELLPVLERHLAALDARLAEQRALRERLAALTARLRADEDPDVGELFTTIEAMTMFEKHFTKDQLAWLEQRRRAVGDDRIREVEAEWPRLIAAVRAEMQRGTDPADPAVQALATRWQALVAEFTGGRADIADGVARVYRHEPAARQRTGLDAEILAYVGRATPRRGG